jgi:hypothetical protein
MELYTYPPIKAGQLGYLSPLALLHHPSKAWGVLYVRTVHELDPALTAKLLFGLVENACPFLVTAELAIELAVGGRQRRDHHLVEMTYRRAFLRDMR